MNKNSVTFFNSQKVIPVPHGFELIIAAWQITNPENIGQIIRLGHNVGAKQILFIQKDENYRESKIKKTAGFSYAQMDWKFISETEFHSFLNDGFLLVVLETCDNSKNLFTTNLPEKCILMAGNESHGLPQKIIETSNLKVHIPMPGGCKSMNVSHAISVAAFEWYRQATKTKFM